MRTLKLLLQLKQNNYYKIRLINKKVCNFADFFNALFLVVAIIISERLERTQVLVFDDGDGYFLAVFYNLIQNNHTAKNASKPAND